MIRSRARDSLQSARGHGYHVRNRAVARMCLFRTDDDFARKTNSVPVSAP
jgi:hypothetical protein